MSAEPAVSPERALAATVFVDGRNRPFGELTADEVEARATELAGASGFGHGGRVAGVAAAWRGFAALMRERGAARVSELEPETAAEHAERLWVIPPGGSLLG